MQWCSMRMAPRRVIYALSEGGSPSARHEAAVSFQCNLLAAMTSTHWTAISCSLPRKTARRNHASSPPGSALSWEVWVDDLPTSMNNQGFIVLSSLRIALGLSTQAQHVYRRADLARETQSCCSLLPLTIPCIGQPLGHSFTHKQTAVEGFFVTG
jgi:hypothetical protein